MTIPNYSVSWEPIATVDNKYNGIFDGKDYTIQNLSIRDEEKDYLALFVAIGEDGVVENLRVDGARIEGKNGVAAICALCEGTIKNCAVAVEDYVYIVGFGNMGGVVGVLQNGEVSKCMVMGETTIVNDGDGITVGCLVGSNLGGKISNCSACGTVFCRNDFGGGLVGSNYDGSIMNCFTALFGTNYAGLVGKSNTNQIINCAYMDAKAGYGAYEEIKSKPVGVVEYEGEIKVKTFTPEQFIFGDAACYLNEGQEDKPWKQTLPESEDYTMFPNVLGLYNVMEVYTYEDCYEKVMKATNDSTKKYDRHPVKYRKEIMPTCSKAGQKEHWECTNCHAKFVGEKCGKGILYPGIEGYVFKEGEEPCIEKVTDEDLILPKEENWHRFRGEGRDVKCDNCPIHLIQSLPDQLNTICPSERGVIAPCYGYGEINVYSIDCIKNNTLYANEESNELEAAVPYLYITNGSNCVFFVPESEENEANAVKAKNVNGLYGVLLEDCDDNGKTEKNYKTVVGKDYAVFTIDGIKYANAVEGNKVLVNRGYIYLPETVVSKPQPSPMARPIAQLDSDVTSVTDVEVEATDADATLYDLSGRSVDASSVRNAFVIKKQGDAVIKSFQK